MHACNFFTRKKGSNFMKVKPKKVFNRKLINIDLIKITNEIFKVKVRVVSTIKNSQTKYYKTIPS